MSMKIPFLKNKKLKETAMEQTSEPGKMPEHVAIIMDGNGRWAQKRGLPRFAGHKEGVSTVFRIVKMAVNRNISALTLYTFSTENWKRPESEIEYILKLPKEFLHIYLPDLQANNVKINIIGDTEHLPSYTKEAMEYAIEKTAGNDGLQLNFAINYGSRFEMIHAVKEMIRDVENKQLSIEEIDDDCFSDYLFTKNVKDPDLLIRTGGEMRLSNFLLWQLAYTEFWFSDELWPDFNEEHFEEALEEYKNRKRRYGGV